MSCPLPWVYVVISLVALLAVELGFRLARNRRLRSPGEDQAPVGAIVGATLGLLAFLLAFTLGWRRTVSMRGKALFWKKQRHRYDLSTCRAAPMSPSALRFARYLREYVDMRLQIIQPDKAPHALRRSAELQDELWSRATAAAEQVPAPIAALVHRLCERVDRPALQASQPGISQPRPHQHLGGALFVSSVTMAAVGYYSGMTATRRSPRYSRARPYILCRDPADSRSRSAIRGPAHREPAGAPGPQGLDPSR